MSWPSLVLLGPQWLTAIILGQNQKLLSFSLNQHLWTRQESGWRGLKFALWNPCLHLDPGSAPPAGCAILSKFFSSPSLGRPSCKKGMKITPPRGLLSMAWLMHQIS